MRKKINKIKNGKLNAKLKDYKPIKRKDFMSVEIEPTKDKQDIKLTLNTKNIFNSLGKGMFINFIRSSTKFDYV